METCRFYFGPLGKLKKSCNEICQIERDNKISRLSLDIVKYIDNADVNGYGDREIPTKCAQLCKKLQNIFDLFEDVERVRNLCDVAQKFVFVVRNLHPPLHLSRFGVVCFFLSRDPSSFLYSAVQNAKEKLKYYDLLQVPSGETSYQLGRLRQICNSNCGTRGGINLSKKEIDILASTLLCNVKTFHRESENICEMLCRILNDLEKMEDVERDESLTDSIMKRFISNQIMRNACHQICGMEGEVGVLARDLLECCITPYNTYAVLTKWEKLCDKYGILLNRLKNMDKAWKIIVKGSALVGAVTALSQISFEIDGTAVQDKTSMNLILEELQRAKKRMAFSLNSLIVSFFRFLFVLFWGICKKAVLLEEIKHGISLKVTRLVLYNCGDIERNPGPVLRDFRKSQQTPFLIMIYRKLNKEPPSPNSLYTEGPPFFWNQYPGVTDADYFNIPNVAKHNKEKGTCYREEDCKKSFQRIIDILRIVMREEMPDDLAKVLRCYEDLMRKKKGSKENKEYYEQCEKEIEVWVLKKQKTKFQKDLCESKSELELCLEHKLVSGCSISSREVELMQKLICLSQNQTKTTGDRKRRQEDLLDDNNTQPSYPKYSRQDSELPSFDNESFRDVLDLLDSDLSPGSSISNATRGNTHDDQSGTSSPSLCEYNQEEQALEIFVHELCKDLID